ncbi:MAG: hypothetical protein QGI75_04585 [Phycisphaerales bacterium]|jgi:photosystem II stability/assembly factor-like uncharacterized protein|nr:hypothetical protein [Phycisphaerales bacterium]MDP6986461.1 hypothetical protein [Phycisphaerales bacterium]
MTRNHGTLVAVTIVCASAPSASATAADYGTWTEQDYGLATFFAGVSFTDAFRGWTVGGTNGVGSVIHRTLDGGESWSLSSVPSTLMLLASDAVGIGGEVIEEQHMWTCGVQFLVEPGMLVTHDDGSSWSSVMMPGSLQWSSQCLQAVDEMHIKVPSVWAEVFGPAQTGICISNDGGASFTGIEWGIDTFARYCHFLDNDRGWMTGGDFPEDRGDRGYTMFDGYPSVGRLPESFSKEGRGEQYVAAIARTTDGGHTWTQLFWDVGNFYLNQIFMLNDNDGWAVGGGPNYTPYLLHTDDGWATMEYQTLPGANYTLMTVDFMNANEGFAIGFGPNGAGDVEMVCLHTMDGGVTWTGDLPGLTTGPLDTEFLDRTIGWTVGSNNMNQTTIARYENDPIDDCPEDVDGDGLIGVDDVLMIIGAWGPCSGCAADVDGDGAVDVDDLLAVVAAWGSCS